MRRLSILLVFALPLLAQEDEAPPAADPTQLDALLREILQAPPEQRGKLLDALRARLVRDRTGFRTAMTVSNGAGGLSVVYAGPGFKEAMSGTWVQDGRQGDYTLRSAGSGIYELRAVIQGGAEPIADKGSFAELMRKYPFLRNRGYLFLTPVRTPATPAIGCRVRPASEALRYHLALPQGAGLLVEEVRPGSRAARLGLKRFDVLVRFDGEPIDDPAQLEALERGRGTLEYVRRGKTRTLEPDGVPAAPGRPGR